MSKKLRMKMEDRLSWHHTLRYAILIGILLLIIVMACAGHREAMSTKAAAESAMSTMKQQCISFNKLTSADRTKSLFRLSDMMRNFSSYLAGNPELVNDESLEEYVDNVRLSGIAILDENLELEASGYTRPFRNTSWANSPDGSHFSDILEYPAKVYMERIFQDGEYYDICAVAREDAPGIIIGFYRQPSGLITDTENDLESMLTGLHLERGGHYAIAEDGEVRVTSDEPLIDAGIKDSAILQRLSAIPKDGHLHPFYANGTYSLGYHSGCENYSLYIYYPASSLASAWISSAAIFAAGYSSFLLLFIAFRNRALREKQEELQKSNQSLSQTVEMLKALETIYFTLFYVDLKENQYDSIYIAPWLQPIIPKKGIYTELKQLFLSNMVVPDFRNDIDLRMSPEFIRRNLNRESISDVRKSFYTDYQAVRGDQIRWCRVTATVVDYDEEGNPYHILALIQDIDREKVQEAQYQAQIMKEAQEARVANHAKTEFLRRISHDIRTPINGIKGYIDLGARHPEDPHIQEHCRENAKIALNTLLDLVNSVLDMSKLESGKILPEDKSFNLTELLDSANTILAPQAYLNKVHYEVLRQGPVPVPYLIGSPNYVSQIIMNIAGNAIKYSRPGGYVRVNTRFVETRDDQVTYDFICEDDGIGMSEEFQQHMYEPFMQEDQGARTTYEGVGLGLSIMKKLVDSMDGTVICSSQKNIGTTFRVRLTFHIDRSYQPPAEQSKVRDEKLLEGKKILLAEDNELNMEIAEMLLKERGAIVTKAWNGREAVEKFASSAAGFYDLIFMDIMMPEMNGMEATRAIRAMNRPDAKTVLISAMSANAFQEDIQNSLDAGMNAHLSKPIGDEKIMAVTAALFAERCVIEGTKQKQMIQA